ncbi:MAG: DUF2723 domain-containing protein [Gemmatimonadales bacterium]|nr:DUF2723 domain-containing protein [Gemmatimonadales bacterium]
MDQQVEQLPPPWWWAAGTGVVVFLIYLATLAPTTAFWDTSEYIAAAKVLGIPHPPGNPLFALTAHVWGLLPLAADYAVRINLFAAVTSAASAALFFLVAERWLRGIVEHRGMRIACAFAGILASSTMWTVWNQSTVNEKVYTLSLFSMALVLWLAVHWGDDAPGAHRDRWLVLIAYVIALSSTNHMMGVLAAPAVAVYVLWTDWRALTRPFVVGGALVAGVLGVSVNYLFLPIRAAQYPAINEGEPIGFFSQALADVLGRVQYAKPSVFERQADLGSQLLNWWQYWSWQFARDWGIGAALFTGIFTVLAVVGLVQLFRSERRAGVAAAALFGTLVPALIFYLNFKYGYSMHPEQPDLAREVRERDYFFLCSFAAMGLLFATGFGAIVRAVAHASTGERRWLLGAPALLVALVPAFGNRVTASRAGETIARDFARDILESVEPYGILITAGDNDTFPLWYAQEVEGIRRDVTLANLSLMNTRWHLKQLRRRETPAFEPSRSVPLWGGDRPAGAASGAAVQPAGGWVRPTTPPLAFPEAQLDSLPEVVPIEQNSRATVGPLEVTFGQPYLQLSDIATLALIKDNAGKRPIFFSWSDGSYPDQTFGLTPYLVSQGLVRKLMDRPVVESETVVMAKGLGFMDLARTKVLLKDTYRWQAAALDRPRGWVDPPSSSILMLYQVIYGAAAQALRDHGDAPTAAFADSVSQAVARSVGRK